MMTQHIDKQYEGELQFLKEQILKTGNVVEQMIANSMKSLVERNSDLAQEVLQQDNVVNQLEMDIDDFCLRLLALRQPAASDLRFISIGLRISKDLERMGDLAVNISEQSLELIKEPQLRPYVDLPQMAALSQKMVKESLDAFVNRDPKRAGIVCETDDAVDTLYDKVFAELSGLMKKESENVERGMRLILVCRHLERIADHATNIAEQVIFMVQGRDIRHGKGEC